jgi:hypothetical protein
MIENNSTSSRLDIENFYIQSPTSDFFESNVMAFVKANASEITAGKVYQLYADNVKTTRCNTADTNLPPSALFMEISKNENAAAIGPDSTSGDESAAIVADIMGTTGVQVAARTNLNNVLIRAVGQFHSDSNAAIDTNAANISNNGALPRANASTSRAFLHLLAILAGRNDLSAWTQAQQAIALVAANLEPVVRGVDAQELSPHDVGGNCLWYYWPDAVAAADRLNANLANATQGAPTTIEFKTGSASAAVTLATAAYSKAVQNLLATNVPTSMKKAHARLDFSAGTPSRGAAIMAALYYSGLVPASGFSNTPGVAVIGDINARQADTAAMTAAELDAEMNIITAEQGKWVLNAFSPKLSATTGATYFTTTTLTNNIVRNVAVSASDSVMAYIRTQTANAATYQIWDSLLDAAWPIEGDYQVTGSIVAYPNTNLFLFTNFINLANDQLPAGSRFTKIELNLMIGNTQTENWGKLNSSTNLITAQGATTVINTLTGSLMAGYNEYKLLQSGANGASDITSDDIVEYLLNASGGSYDSIDNAMVVAMITNALTKATKGYLI